MIFPSMEKFSFTNPMFIESKVTLSNLIFFATLKAPPTPLSIIPVNTSIDSMFETKENVAPADKSSSSIPIESPIEN